MRQDCVFCRKICNGGDEHGPIERELQGCVMFTPLNPVTPGHKVFTSEVHDTGWKAYSALNIGELMMSAAMYAQEQGEHYNLIVNIGSHASQTVEHVHVHYVPRRENDGLKLPWTDQKREEHG